MNVPAGQRRWAVQALALSAALVAGTARADAPHSAELPHAEQVLRYTKPAPTNYLRASLEELGLLGLGLAHYIANHRANSSDWDFDYTWPSFRRKITGSGYTLDTNLFDTNFITHPGGGTLYYLAARGNRLPVLAAFAFALAASTIWEIFGEFRESASINDMLVTPVSGFVLGETTFQLGALFDRSCASTASSVLGTVLAPSKAIHDAIDGATPSRDTSCDAHGLSRLGVHEFRFALRSGGLFHLQGPQEPPYLATQLALQTKVIALDTYGRPGTHLQTFADGNVSELIASIGMAGSAWNDFELRSSVVPFGLHYRDLTGLEPATAQGSELLFGLLVGMEYSRYRYDRKTGEDDRYFSIDLPGASLSYLHRDAQNRWELEFRASTTFAGVDAFALPDYTLYESEENLTSVARSRGYNYAAGFSLQPRVRVISRHVEVGVELRATRLWAITAFDRVPEWQSHVSVLELRRNAMVWVALAPAPSVPWRVTLSSAIAQRWGSIAQTARSRTDVRLLASLECVL